MLYDIFGNVIPPKSSPRKLQPKVPSQWEPPSFPQIPAPGLPPPLKPTWPAKHLQTADLIQPKMHMPDKPHCPDRKSTDQQPKQRILDPKQVWLAKSIQDKAGHKGPRSPVTTQDNPQHPLQIVPTKPKSRPGIKSEGASHLGVRQAGPATTGHPPASRKGPNPTSPVTTKGAVKISIVRPPDNLRKRSQKYHKYEEDVRQRSLELMEKDPRAFKQMAKEWLDQAHGDGRMCARTLNNLVFCDMGVRIREFVAFYKAHCFSEAVELALSWNQSILTDEAKGASVEKPEKEKADRAPPEKISRTTIPRKGQTNSSAKTQTNKNVTPYSPQMAHTKNSEQHVSDRVDAATSTDTLQAKLGSDNLCASTAEENCLVPGSLPLSTKEGEAQTDPDHTTLGEYIYPNVGKRSLRGPPDIAEYNIDRIFPGEPRSDPIRHFSKSQSTQASILNPMEANSTVPTPQDSPLAHCFQEPGVKKVIIADPTQPEEPQQENSHKSGDAAVIEDSLALSRQESCKMQSASEETRCGKKANIAEPQALLTAQSPSSQTANTPPRSLLVTSPQTCSDPSEGKERKKVSYKKLKKTTKVGLNQSLTEDAVNDFIRELKEPVAIDSLAKMYGVDLACLKASLAKETDSPEFRAANKEMQVLEGIKKYLTESRADVKQSGNVFHFKIPPLPCRILSIEQKRFENLLHSNHKNRHTYTNVGAGVLYWCPLPGCAGATLNQASVKRALLPHCRAYRNTESLRFVFNIETKRSREIFLFPPDSAKMFPECASPAQNEQEIPQRDMMLTPLTQEDSKSLEPISGNQGGEPEEIRSRNSEGDTPRGIQDNASVDDFDAERNLNSLDVNPGVDTSHFQEVSRGHSGAGEHILTLTSTGALEAKEYGAPIAHHAKRKRGSEVTAPGLLMSKGAEEGGQPASSQAPHERVGIARSESILGAGSSPTCESAGGLKGFRPGGALRTVPS